MTRNLDDLNLDIDLDESLRQRVDLDQARIDGAGEATKLGDQAHIALRHRLVGVRATDTAWNSTEETDAGTEGIDCAIDQSGETDSDKTFTYSSIHTSLGLRPPRRPGEFGRTRVVDLLVVVAAP